MKKQKTFEIHLTDQGDLVKVIMACNEKMFLDYENEESKPVRVRVPLPNKDKFINSGLGLVEREDRWESLEPWLNFYVKCRDKEIFEQVQEIRKSVKRIRKYTQARQIALEAYKEYEAKNT